MNTFLVQALAALWLGIGIDHVMSHSPNQKDNTSGIPTVTLSSQVFLTKDLQCYEELTCRVNATKDGIKRVLGIILFEETSQTDLKKVAILDYLETNRSAFDGDKVETVGAFLTQHGDIVVHKALPPNAGFNGAEYVCEAVYLADDLSKVSVESNHLREKCDNSKSSKEIARDQLEKKVSDVEKKLDDILSKISHLTAKSDAPTEKPIVVPSCENLQGQGQDQGTKSRPVITWYDGTKVMCDTETDGGRWTIFQRRFDGHLNFLRDWNDYENGFGDPEVGEYWLGLKPLQRLLETGDYEMRVDMKFNGSDYFERYTSFKLSPPCSNYTISFIGSSGTAKDSLRRMLGQAFSTYDRDHDTSRQNCAADYFGAWWYDKCHTSNLNGLWGSTEYGNGLNWLSLTGYYKSVTFSEMKVRRLTWVN